MSNLSDETKMEMMREALIRIEKEADEFEARLEKKFDDYLLQIIFDSYKERLDDRIKPLERLVYGMVGLILLTVLGAVIATVVIT